MNLEMQNLNAEIPRPVPAEKAEAIENAENFEQELSFEQTEKIMAKVCDIGKKTKRIQFWILLAKI